MLYRVAALVVAAVCFSAPARAITRSWTGATSASWSDASNWSPAGIPVPADKLVFPAGVTRTVMTNDLPAGTTVGAMDFRIGYTLDGNPLTLTGNLTFDELTAPWFYCNVDLTLAAPVRLGAITSEYTGAIDVNGQTLTIDSYNTSFRGALNGTGAIVVNGSGISIASSGNFTGTITGTVDLVGAMPNATFSGALSGNGTTGPVTIVYGGLFSASALYLGSKNPAHPADPHTIGTLHTKAIAIGAAFHADLVPGGASDQLQVTGTVSLTGSSLVLDVPSGAPAAGQSFTLIANDGTDAVNGTFADLAEGAQITLAGAAMRISYAGGDGNDVVVTVVASTKTWTGASSALWSNPANWSPAVVPATGEPLLFPAGAARTSMTNDLPVGTSFGPLDFRSGYTLGGNPLTLTGDLTFNDASSEKFVCNAGLSLAAPVRLGAASTSEYHGPISVNGHTLTVDSYNTSFTGAIDGTGSIVVNGSGISIAGSGNFSGTITGTVDLAGAMPNATFSGSLSGHGTIGAVTINSSGLFNTVALRPGTKNPAYMDDPHTIGTLETRSIALNGTFFVDLIPGGPSDQLRVAGAVTLGGSLIVSVPNGTAGQSFTIIDNDGSDAVNGTFAGLPEGAQIAIPGGVLQITYSGGTGNDVVLLPLASTKTWTGAVSGLWSNAANWSPAAPPANGEALNFPAGVARTEMTNDLPGGMSVGAMTFGIGYTLNGNALTLTGDLMFDQSTGPLFVCNAPLELGGSVRLGAAGTSEYNGTIAMNGQVLTIDSYNTSFAGAIDGAGSIVVNGSGISVGSSGSFSGTITGTVDAVGAMPNATIHGALSGNSTLGVVTTQSLYLGSKNPAHFADPHTIGTLHTKTISIGGPFRADLVPGGVSDLLQVTGSVTLGGSLLLSVPTGSPIAGQTFTVIENDATDAISGTFEGLPEASVVSLPPWKFRISYVAGDGNDVMLTTIEDTATEPIQEAVSTQVGETTTLSARVTAKAGVPVGDVTFTDNGSVVKTVPLVNGLAAFAYATLDPGTHTLTARYDGTPVFAPSVATFTHEVERGQTSIVLVTPPDEMVYGDELRLSVHVAPVAPASGTPTGSVLIDRGTSTIAAGHLADGDAALSPVWLEAGTHTIIASYAGDSRFHASDSTNSSVTVLKAPTITDAALSEDAPALTLTIHVSAEDRPELPVVGVVQVMDGSIVIAQQAVAAGPVEIAIGTLSPGEHRLTVSYLGTNNFEPSSTTIVHTRRGKRRAMR